MTTATLTRAEEIEAARMTRFFERVQEGCGPLNAAIEVGWGPAKLDRLMRDDDFSELLGIARERLLEDLEEVVVQKARDGNVKCLQMVLYNQRSEKWKDVRHIKMERSGAVDPGIVSSVKAAMIDVLRAGNDAIAAMQPAPVIIEATAVEVHADHPAD